jgi:hypothetical protein
MGYLASKKELDKFRESIIKRSSFLEENADRYAKACIKRSEGYIKKGKLVYPALWTWR